MENAMNDLSVAELQKMIKKAVEDGNQSALMKVGIDLNDSINVQRDLAFSRKQREASEKITLHARAVLIGMMIVGAGSVLFLGIKEALKVGN
jgi:hypothetical protein